MRESVREFVKIAAETFQISEPIYEFGSFQVQSNADLRPFFPWKEYIGCDMQEGPGVDKILNLHNIDLPDQTAGSVLLVDTLEHVEFPHKALEEVYRILKPQGFVLITSHMKFPIHSYPYDYWRFTPEAFKSLLRPFSQSFVGFTGVEEFPHTVVGIGFKGENVSLEPFLSKYEEWKIKWHYIDRQAWKRFLKLLSPPIILNIYYKIRKIMG
jgi:SAM-dependent methyltransferase